MASNHIAIPTKAQAEVLRKHGLIPFVYAVLEDCPQHLIVVHRINGTVKKLGKEGIGYDRF